MSRPRTRRLALTAAVITTGVSLTACGDSSKDGANTPTASASSTTAPKGVVTTETAKRLVDAYEKVNNQANKTRNAKLLSTVESGQLHELSKAEYKEWLSWSAKDQKEYGTAFYYRQRKYLIPPADKATWFAVKATSTYDAKYQTLLIFDKVGSIYKMVFSAYTEGKLPEVSLDRDGHATVADASTKVGTLAPDQLGAAYEDFFETGGKKKGTAFAPTESSKESTKIYQDRNSVNGRWADKTFFAADPTFTKAYALKLTSGDVLAVFPTAHTSEQILKPAYRSSFLITPADEEAVYNAQRRVVVTDEFQGQALAELSTAKKARVLGIRYRMVDSR
ncbi:hypothetical protein ACFZDK_49885 [Streptomyces sp. NPDC007901]|uniref:hypothetical protein n=1 Tax=Streptomyces sp. NPDC007901 TaxID=3364785 RepID=UPI0036E729BA